MWLNGFNKTSVCRGAKKSGNPDAPIGGITVTMMATLDVDASYPAFGTNAQIARQQPPLRRRGIFCK